MKTKLILNIHGNKYNIITDENVDDMIELAKTLDDKITSILEENPHLSVTQASVYAALAFADSQREIAKDAKILRDNVQKYLARSLEARTDAERYKREVERLKKEVETLRNK